MPNMKDLYMQFASWAGDFDTSDATTLVASELNTGLSIRGGLVWLIHLIEWEVFQAWVAATHERVFAALSTVPGLAAIPEFDDAGCISRYVSDSYLNANGAAVFFQPIAFHYLPPIPLAAPLLTMYFQAETNSDLFDGEKCRCRIGYTTKPIDEGLYAEVAEVWSYKTGS
jgi:hypothetical protein